MQKCSKSLKNNKTGGNDGLVGELFKNGGKGMANLLKVLYGVDWTQESIPKQWSQGLIVSLYKKGDAEDPDNLLKYQYSCKKVIVSFGTSPYFRIW